jgi:hypothetical protein
MLDNVNAQNLQQTLGRWVAAAAAGVLQLRQAWQQQRTAALAEHTARRKELLQEVQQEHKVGGTLVASAMGQ